MNKKIIILGANGMLGGSIFRYFSSNGVGQVLGTVRTDKALCSVKDQGFSNVVSGIDALSFETIENLVEDFSPDFIINCIGVIKQVNQVNLPVPTIELNSLLPHRLAKISTACGAQLIHFSTDCVFSGEAGMYVECDVPDSADLYGRSKLLGEVAYDSHLTLRTSIIGHEIDSNFSLVDWFLSQEGPVNGYTKAVFSGFPTVFVAQFIEQYVLKSGLSGLYHLSAEAIDKCSLLKLVAEYYGKPTEIFPTADVKLDRSLNSSKLKSVTGFNSPDWSNLIEIMHNEYQQYFRK